MKINFLTLPKYGGTEQQIRLPGNPLAEMSGAAFSSDTAAKTTGVLQTVQNEQSPLRKSINNIIEGEGYTDLILGIQKLVHEDVNGLGNELFRIEGEQQTYLLKILNSTTSSNKREILVWKYLGFDQMDGYRRREKIISKWIPCLPKFVSLMENYWAVILPYYPKILAPAVGASHELPLVLSLLLNFDQAFHELHKEGWLYMDFHPGNILFNHTAENTLLLFLTDMGSARPLCGGCTSERFPEWKELNKKLNGELCNSRWTKADVAPPDTLFPLESGCPNAIPAAYDFYTLARTAFILSGFTLECNDTYDSYRKGLLEDMLQRYPENPILEKPLLPVKKEVEKLYELIKPMLFNGESLDREKAYKLLQDFFERRAKNIAYYLGHSQLGREWENVLIDRIDLYRTALKKTDKKQAKETWVRNYIRSAEQESQTDFSNEIKIFNKLPLLIRENKDHEATVRLFQQAAATQLVANSETAKYSYVFHQKVFRLLSGRPANISKLESPINQLPEKKTLRELKKYRKLRGKIDLAILSRNVGTVQKNSNEK